MLRNYFYTATDINRTHEFAHTSGRVSILLGNAVEKACPAISFTFNPEFVTDSIIGTKDNRDVEIYNLYDDSHEIKITGLVSARECRAYNPAVKPFWNTEATASYHKSIENKLATIKKHPQQKISILKECAGIIAELNGWEYDESITKLNKTTNAFRAIYRSAKFSKDTAYLSIDFEKPEIFFELHDKKGKHLGEFKWDGSRSKVADKSAAHKITIV